ncbi:MAG: hypothetical protein RMJ98_18585, partial [Myxococcales bacterium]|nr:hypothetical protein [Polyangiaceae bacterium]MDW8251307.1 hypothetical protein [Myxococcales bacterium]
LRYARTWATTGAPVYNPGERVEGYTSFLFTASVALLTRFGIDPPVGARLLGACGAIALLAASLALLRGLVGRRSWPGSVALLALLASSAPVAAWSLGGLETSVFAALASAGLAAGFAGFRASNPTNRNRQALLAGATLGLATLARPEGAIFLSALFLAWAGLALRQGVGGALIRLTLAYLALVLPHAIWRWSYYGHLLPNTFYVKWTGPAEELWFRGLRYGELALQEMNPVLILAGFLGLLAPGNSREQVAALWTLRLTVTAGVLTVLRVGGDFLDLYRFFVPLWSPLLAAALRPLTALEDTARQRHPRGAMAVAVLGLLLAAGHGLHQARVGERSLQISEPERAARHLEPLGWTREYALRWAAMGRWVADLARPGDTMAVGAAGAMPYFAQIPNLDLLGLCDAHIAHHGHVIGTRPGHQRFAPHGYLLERRPTFLFFNPESFHEGPRPLGPDSRWNPLGWVWAEAILDPSRHGYPRPLRMHFFLRRERAEELRGHPAIRIAEDNPR